MGESSVSKNKSINRFENSRSKLFREHRTARERRAAFFKTYAWMMLVACLLCALLMPALTVVLTILFLVVFLFSLPLQQSSGWLLREPLFEKSEKERDKLPRADREKLGLLYLGNARDIDNKAVSFSKSDLVTHGLVLGTTGSGKTQLLLGIFVLARAM